VAGCKRVFHTGSQRDWRKVVVAMQTKNTSAAANDHGGFGRWAFLEIVDPWDAKNTIRKHLNGMNMDGVSLMFSS